MLQYTVLLLCVISHCVISKPSDTTNELPGPNTPSVLKANNQVSSKMENSTPMQHVVYVYGLQQLKMQSAIGPLQKAGNDYLITPGWAAHKLHLRKLSWNKARRVCIEEGGHLAVINSMSEEKMLRQIMEENEVNLAWLGVHDIFEEGDWISIMDEPLEATGYSRWTTKYPNEPDNFGNKQHCGILDKDGGLDDLECNASHSFFCKIPF